MTTVKKMAVVPYSDQQMYELVNDVAQYPSFLPFCRRTRVLSQDASHLCAELTFAKGAVEKSFTTRNALTPYRHMEVTLVDGPFKRMDGYWQFKPMANGYCQIEFELDYEFNSKVLMLMFGPLFHQVANTLVDTFCQQAESLYAKR